MFFWQYTASAAFFFHNQWVTWPFFDSFNGSVEGKITGRPQIFWENPLVSDVDFPLNQSVDAGSFKAMKHITLWIVIPFPGASISAEPMHTFSNAYMKYYENI